MDELREKHKFTNAKAAQPQNWYSFSSGKSGITYTASFASGGKLRAELYIDLGDATKNKSVFDAFKKDELAINMHFGEALTWERLDTKRASRIYVMRDSTSIADATNNADEVRSWLIHRLLKLKEVFGPRLKGALDLAELPNIGLAISY